MSTGAASPGPARRQAVVVMGVSGSGKTTVAEHLADALGWERGEADDFHPRANIEKMERGQPLDDADRAPWLAAIRDWLDARAAAGHDVVVTCSALKRSYRDVLRGASPRVRFLQLSAPEPVLAARIGSRRGHFMPPSLLSSQLATLEPLGEDEDGVVVDVSGSAQQTLTAALGALHLP